MEWYGMFLLVIWVFVGIAYVYRCKIKHDEALAEDKYIKQVIHDRCSLMGEEVESIELVDDVYRVTLKSTVHMVEIRGTFEK